LKIKFGIDDCIPKIKFWNKIQKWKSYSRKVILEWKKKSQKENLETILEKISKIHTNSLEIQIEKHVLELICTPFI